MAKTAETPKHPSRPRVGISACLLGEPVRYNGDHKRQDWLVEELGRFVTWVPVCPEMAMGLGTPRETLKLQGRVDSPRMVGNQSGEDRTELAQRVSRGIVRTLVKDLDAFIFKKDSPSCGWERVRVYGKNNIPRREGTGLFAATVRESLAEFPHGCLPVIEEGRLSDPRQREAFVIELFAWARFRRLPRKVAALQEFHRDYKLLLMSRDPKGYAELGRIAAEAHGKSLPGALDRYAAILLASLGKPAQARTVVNALQHLQGYFKTLLNATEKNQLIEKIEEYRQGTAPLAAPLAIIQFLARRHELEYLNVQSLFAPYPKGLRLEF